MKSYLLVLILILSRTLVSPLKAQSTFRFENFNASAGIDAPVFDANGVRLAGTDYAAELWGGALSNSLSPTLVFDSGQRFIRPFDTGLAAGYLVPFGASMTVWAVPGGGFAWLQVRAWETRLGATYEDAVLRDLGGYGESPVFFAQGGNPLGLPTLPAPLVGLQSFSLREVVPEPSTWALLTLGGAMLCCLSRRRKRQP